MEMVVLVTCLLYPPNQAPNSSGLLPGQRNMSRKPSDLHVQCGPANSPNINVNPLKSPTLRQVQSPMLGSPSGNLKSPQTPSQLAGMLSGPSAAAVAAAAAIKSPPMMGSAGASPVHMKSPSLPAPSPGWTLSPKPPMQSPGIPQNNKPPLSMTSPNMMGSVEQGTIKISALTNVFISYYVCYTSLLFSLCAYGIFLCA